jgi:hypothetical protein
MSIALININEIARQLGEQARIAIERRSAKIEVNGSILSIKKPDGTIKIDIPPKQTISTLSKRR